MRRGPDQRREEPDRGGARRVARQAAAWAFLLAAAGAAAPAAAETAPRRAAAAGACAPDAIRLPPGADIAAAAREAREGARFCILAGEHRLQAIVPRDRQVFQGQPGAVLNGSRRLASFTREGRFWFAAGRGPEGRLKDFVDCDPEMPRCSLPGAVFIDDAPLRHAADLRRLSSGRFFIDRARGRIYIADDPAGRKVEAGVSPYAFKGGPRGVVVRGLTVEKYATAAQAGAIGSDIASEGWTIEGNEVRLNATLGVSAGSRSRVAGNRIHGNGQMGAGCVGDDILFEGNELSDNGHFAGVDPTWEAGGAKCAKTRRLVVRGNLVRGNRGAGFWTDIDNIHTLYEGNRVEDNTHSGIAHEISYAAVIRNNTLARNGEGFHSWLWGAGILVQNSRDVEVHSNTVVTGRGNGIALVQQNRGAGARGAYRTTGNYVHDNTIVADGLDGGVSGALADFDLAGLRAGRNRFDRNTYRVHGAAAGRRWAWVDGFYDWDAFRARSAQEAGGTVQEIPRAGAEDASAAALRP